MQNANPAGADGQTGKTLINFFLNQAFEYKLNIFASHACAVGMLLRSFEFIFETSAEFYR
jgi:hypothetical protein